MATPSFEYIFVVLRKSGCPQEGAGGQVSTRGTGPAGVPAACGANNSANIGNTILKRNLEGVLILKILYTNVSACTHPDNYTLKFSYDNAILSLMFRENVILN